ncbi:MAG: ATP-binding protein [Candidatus Hodarchaeota archaeon]
MKRGRVFGYIYEINSLELKAYLLPGTDSLIQSHPSGISKIARIGSYVIINSAGTKLIGVVNSLHVTEPEKLYWLRTQPDYPDRQLIRTITINLIGQFYYDFKQKLRFERGINTYPSIDEEVLAPTQDELDLILNEEIEESKQLIEIGNSYPTNDIRIKINPARLFSRHCGVFGGTGTGKSCTVTIVVNEIINKNINMPIFIFDINGEYSWAWSSIKNNFLNIYKFAGKLDADYPQEDKIIKDDLKFNYTSFSRNTYRAIFKPSEKTQIPALNFACDALKYIGLSINDLMIDKTIKSYIPQHLTQNPDKALSNYIVGDPSETDSNKLSEAYETLKFVTILTARDIGTKTTKNVMMRWLAKIITDRWSIVPRGGNFQYDTFRYGNVASLCDRITELCRDRLFGTFCDTSGKCGLNLSITTKASFKINGDIINPKITIFDLSMVPQEYLPIVIDALLEEHLLDALKGCFVNNPHLLVLDEAHHYLGRRDLYDTESVYLSNPPGERIAKEGRKYGLHILVASQRPRELSNTVISQIGTIISHALTHESDREIISGFGTYSDKTILDTLSILPRREAVIIGQAISMPTRFKVTYLPEDIQPRSKDPLEYFLKINSEEKS